MKMAIKGAGGGGSKQARAPVEAPDSLRSVAYARILDLVSEGEIYGFADQANPLACVFYDETPVANADGSLNFKNVQVDSRTGTQTQDYIKGFPSVENEIGVSVELKVDTPWTRNITNLNLSAVRVRLSVPALSKADTSNGDISGYSVAYVIELATNGGSFVKALDGSFTGKASSKYERSHRIDLPAATTGWTIRVRRLTASANSSAIQDSTFVDSFTEIIDAKLRYPMSALVSTVIDADQFNNIPSRAYHLKGRIIKVPSNYNPTTRVYTGVWDGTFQSAYSNNPAWVFYDAVTSKRYGLGERVTPDLMDKWALYKIGRYCDQMVPDGRGGTEPRFTANFYAQTQDDAYRVLQNMATMFRGIMYAAGSAITAVADMPEDAVYTYHQGNVGEEGFSYSGSGKRARHTVALVSWNDLTDFGRAKVEYVADDEGIARYGIQPTDVMAIGCTSRGQAMRTGKYILTTERLETDTVTFTVGLDGTVAAPGKIVKIADPKRAGRRIGGRVREATATAITVDAVPVVAPGDTITCILPDTTPQTRTVASIAGTVITVTTAFTQIPVPHSAWVVESAELVAQTFRVLSVTEKDDGAGYSITALKHVAGKFDYVEQGIKIDEPPISALPSRKQAPATGLAITHREFAGEVTTATIVTMTWVAPEAAVGYEVEWRSGDSSWQPMPPTGAVTAEVTGIRPGSFDFKVVAVNASGIKSPPAHVLGYVVPDQTAAPTVVGELQDTTATHTAELIAQQAAIDAEAAARLAADLDLSSRTDVIAAQVADITAADEWVIGEEYPAGDLVKYSTGLYRALRVNTGKQPDTNPLDWEFIGNYSSLGEAVAASISIGNQNTSEIEAESTRLDAVVARLPAGAGGLASEALVASETAARVAADAANATALTGVKAQLGGGGNLISDPNLDLGVSGWTLGWNPIGVDGPAWNTPNASYVPVNTNTLVMYKDGAVATNTAAGTYVTEFVAAQAGQELIASGYVTTDRSSVVVGIHAFNAAHVFLGEAYSAAAQAPLSVPAKLTDFARPFVKYSLPAETAYVRYVFRMFTNDSGSSPVGRLVRPMLEVAQTGQVAPSEWKGSATRLAAVTQTMQAEVNSVGNIAKAAHTVVLDVNGNISGTRSENDGTTSSFSILATVFRVLGFGSSGMEWRDGYLRIWKGSGQLVLGNNFGASSDLVLWFGPNIGASACTKANGKIWFDNAADAYFGGSLSAGVLKNAAQSSQVGATAQVETGPFGSNGNTRTVVASLTYSHVGVQSSQPWGGGSSGVPQATSATVTVQRSVGGGGWATIGTLSANGERIWTNIGGGQYEYSMSVGGSLTHSDTSGGTSMINYRAVISGAVNWPAASSGVQRLSVISTESP